MEDISFYFDNISRRADSTETSTGHGERETRRIWVIPDLKDYLNFPHVEQTFKIERQITHKKMGKTTTETIYGITSRSPKEADFKKILRLSAVIGP